MQHCALDALRVHREQRHRAQRTAQTVIDGEVASDGHQNIYGDAWVGGPESQVLQGFVHQLGWVYM